MIFLNHERGRGGHFYYTVNAFETQLFPTKWINDLQNCNSRLHRYVFDAAVSFRQLGGTCVFIQQRFDQPHKKGLCEICIAVMKRSFTRDQKDVHTHKKRKIARGFPIDPPSALNQGCRVYTETDETRSGWQDGLLCSRGACRLTQ